MLHATYQKNLHMRMLPTRKYDIPTLIYYVIFLFNFTKNYMWLKLLG